MGDARKGRLAARVLAYDSRVPQAVWTGSISFGLVTIPVRLYPATEPKDVRFHLYDRESGRRIRYERVTRALEPPSFATSPETDEETAVPQALRIHVASPVAGPAPAVAASDVVRGFTLPSGDLVTVAEEELERVRPGRSRTIEIEEFVDLAQIDPVFFEKSYYVAPARDAAAARPYALLLRAMQEAKMVAIGRFVLRTKPHLVAIRPLERALSLETLFFAD